MAGNPTANPSSLDAEQVLQRAFDQTTDRLRTDAGGVTIDSGQMEVAISDTDDSIKIGNGSGVYAQVTPNNALKVALNDANGNPFTLINPLEVHVVGSSTSGDAESVFNDISAVPAGVPTDILTYVVPPGTTAYLNRIEVSGNNIAVYDINIDFALTARQRTYFGGGLNTTFEYTTGGAGLGLSFIAGTSINVKVTHNRPSLGAFEARLQLVLVS